MQIGGVLGDNQNVLLLVKLHSLTRQKI